MAIMCSIAAYSVQGESGNQVVRTLLPIRVFFERLACVIAVLARIGVIVVTVLIILALNSPCMMA